MGLWFRTGLSESRARHLGKCLYSRCYSAAASRKFTSLLFEKRCSRGDWEATDREAMVIDPSAQSERGRRAGQGKDNVRVGIHRFRGRYVFLGRICPGTQNAESNGQGEVDEGIAHCRLQHWIVTSQSDSPDLAQCDLAMGAYTAFLDLDARTRQSALGWSRAGPDWARCSWSACWSVLCAVVNVRALLSGDVAAMASRSQDYEQ
jgi:hypothetical protein